MTGASSSDDDEGILAHAAKAIAEYQGDFLPGAYEDWLLEIRSALERQCVDLCDLICETRMRTGNLTGAVDAARRRIQLEPLAEAGYQTLMRLQADLGNLGHEAGLPNADATADQRETGVPRRGGPRVGPGSRRLVPHGRAGH